MHDSSIQPLNTDSDLNTSLLSTALILLDQQHRIVQLNPAAEQLLGFSTRQTEAADFLDRVKGELNASLLQQLFKQKNSTLIEDLELKTATEIIVVNLIATPCSIKENDGLLLEMQSNRYLQKIRENLHLEQQSRVSEQMIHNLAHEIKNPLGGIKGAAQLLQRKLPADFSPKYAQIIIRESNRLSALVDRMLMPTAPEENQWVNLHQLIEDGLEIVLLQTKKPFKVIKDYDPSLPKIRAAANQIQQALLNLIKNAAEAMQYSKTPPCLTLRSRINHQQNILQSQCRQVIQIDIEDNGMGISDDLAKDIFFPTISSKQSTGLGLSIAQSLVQRHQGMIELKRSTGKTCFSIYLPLKK